MIECIYASAAAVHFSEADLSVLLAKARQKNAANGVTGLLLYHEGSFLQVLEGEQVAVDATMNRIAADQRHGNVALLIRHEIEKPSFGEWRMGFLTLTQASRSGLAGFSDFLRGGALGLHGSADAINRILNAFKEGRYHRSIR